MMSYDNQWNQLQPLTTSTVQAANITDRVPQCVDANEEKMKVTANFEAQIETQRQ